MDRSNRYPAFLPASSTTTPDAVLAKAITLANEQPQKDPWEVLDEAALAALGYSLAAKYALVNHEKYGDDMMLVFFTAIRQLTEDYWHNSPDDWEEFATAVRNQSKLPNAGYEAKELLAKVQLYFTPIVDLEEAKELYARFQMLIPFTDVLPTHKLCVLFGHLLRTEVNFLMTERVNS